MFRRAAILLGLPAALALVSACATPAGGKDPPPVTPTERYGLQTRPVPNQMALAVHAEGLSPRQVEALARFASDWAADRGGPITVSSPSAGGRAAEAAADRIAAALSDHGAPARLSTYGGEAGAPVLVRYERLETVVPDCNRSWTNLTATRKNDTQANFGCAVTANMAAQIETGADIAAPRGLDPADPGRRSTVLGAYRKGEPTATKTETKQAGQVSQAVQN